MSTYQGLPTDLPSFEPLAELALDMRCALDMRWSWNHATHEVWRPQYRERASDQGARGKRVADWQRSSERAWSDLRFESVKVATDGGDHAFEVTGQLARLDPDAVRVELYADGIDGAASVRQQMTYLPGPTGKPGGSRLN